MNLFGGLYAKKDESGIRRRIPLFIRISVTLLFILALLVLVLGGVFSSRYKDMLYRAEVEKGQLTLLHFSLTAKIVLLEEDLLRLNLLTNNYSRDEAVLYLAVADHNQKILAHSDSAKVGENYSARRKHRAALSRYDGAVYERLLASGERVYELSQPLSFQDKFLGTTYLGVSEHYLDHVVADQFGELLRSFSLPLLVLFLTVVSLAFFLTAWIKFPLYQLQTSIKGICRGDLNVHLDMTRNDEFGDLASEVRHLINNLRLKEQTRTDVADYLNCTTLDRILEPPQTNGSSYASRRQVTILFAGIIGFGEYASHAKAEEVVEALNEYIGIATNTILAHGGYVDKFMGDAVVGIFGVSVYREDHTKRAVRAACELQHSLRQHANRNNQLLGMVRIGMSSGVVLSGNIGSASRVEYGSIGESIKEAFWLNGLAQAQEIIISKSIYTLIKDVASVEPLTPQILFGHEGLLEGYRLLEFVDSQQADVQVAT